MLNCPWKTYWARGSVALDWSVRMTKGSRKSFHAHRQVRIPTVAFIGDSSGKMTDQKIFQREAPSIAAASSSSSGIDLMKEVYMRMLKARP